MVESFPEHRVITETPEGRRMQFKSGAPTCGWSVCYCIQIFSKDVTEEVRVHDLHFGWIHVRFL